MIYDYELNDEQTVKKDYQRDAAQWNDFMEDERIKEETKKIIKQRREEGWKVVCCRLCGETWLFSPYYTDDELKGFEYNICRGRIARGY